VSNYDKHKIIPIVGQNLSQLQSTEEKKVSPPEGKITDFEEFTGFADRAFEDLDKAKAELEEKANQIKDLATKSSEQFGGAIKMNADLKSKVVFMQELISSLNAKNAELETTNKELQKQKAENDKLNSDLRRNLEKVVLKEKELELQ